METLINLFWSLVATSRDVLPIAVVLFGFQYLVIRQPLPNLRSIIIGFIYVVVGLSFFLIGLEKALFPLGKLMAAQLTDPAFIHGVGVVVEGVNWQDYYMVYLFAAAIGFATTIAEPSLIAVAIKASEVSGGAISVWGLRIAVAIGVAVQGAGHHVHAGVLVPTMGLLAERARQADDIVGLRRGAIDAVQ